MRSIAPRKVSPINGLNMKTTERSSGTGHSSTLGQRSLPLSPGDGPPPARYSLWRPIELLVDVYADHARYGSRPAMSRTIPFPEPRSTRHILRSRA